VCVCVCVYMYIYICIYAYICTHVHTYCEDPHMQMPLIELEGDVRLNVTLILTTSTHSYV